MYILIVRIKNSIINFSHIFLITNTIINKESTRKYLPLLSEINADGGGRRFASGGILTSPLPAPNVGSAQTDMNGKFEQFLQVILTILYPSGDAWRPEGRRGPKEGRATPPSGRAASRRPEGRRNPAAQHTAIPAGVVV